MESIGHSVSDDEAVAGSYALSHEDDGRPAQDSRPGEWDNAQPTNLGKICTRLTLIIIHTMPLEHPHLVSRLRQTKTD